MRWSYKTVHYELQKEGLLGSTFLDESEVEKSLNDYGKAGWELVSILETLDGLIAVFKQPLSYDSDIFSSHPRESAAVHQAADQDRTGDEGRAAAKKEDETAAVDEQEIMVEMRTVDDEPETLEESSDDVITVDVGSIRIE